MAKPVILTVDDDPRVGQAVGRSLERRFTHEQTFPLFGHPCTEAAIGTIDEEGMYQRLQKRWTRLRGFGKSEFGETSCTVRLDVDTEDDSQG